MEPGEQQAKPKNKAWLWILLAVLLACVAVGALWWWLNARQAEAVSCSPKDLALSIGRSEAENNKQYVFAVLTNSSVRSCTLAGYPTVSLLDGGGARLGLTDAEYNEAYPANNIILAPRERAHAVLGFPNADLFGFNSCTETSATLRLYLPGDIVPTTMPLKTPLEQQVCPGYSVSSLQPGS